MVKQQSGFTLIELIAVLVILGILAATAVPKFINLQDEARLAAVQSVAGSIDSASALNHAVDLAIEAGLSSDPLVTVTACDLATVNNLLQSPLSAAEYTVTGAATIADKATGTCTLDGPGTGTADSADFTLIGANP